MHTDLQYPFDPQLLLRKRKSIKRELLSTPNLMDKHIAILGGSTTHDIRDMLELFLLDQGIRPVFLSPSTPSTGRTPCSTTRSWLHLSQTSSSSTRRTGTSHPGRNWMIRRRRSTRCWGRPWRTSPPCGTSSGRPTTVPSSRTTSSTRSTGCSGTRTR